MLLSAGEPLPSTIFVHGYLTIDGEKMSKSLGNVVDPADLVERYGAEGVRYWMLREVPPTGDADYTDDKLERRYNADLANDLGNLLNRTISMIRRYRDGQVPASIDPHSGDALGVTALPEAITNAMGIAYDPQQALAAIWDCIVQANRYVETTSPWTLAKSERGGNTDSTRALDTALYTLAETLRVVAVALQPFLPETSVRIAQQLGVQLGEKPWLDELTWGGLQPGTTVGTPEPIFPRLESAVSEPTH
jgi:methionyl-tRNA synthetase